MAKTVKGARIRLRRTNTAGAVPTIPPNDDHTTGWLDTDIYIGELFINTSVTGSRIWFRETTGITEIATLDKTTNRLPIGQLTNNKQEISQAFASSYSFTSIVNTGVQYIIIKTAISGLAAIFATHNIDLTNLETVGTVSLVHISLEMNNNTQDLVVYFNSSVGVVLSVPLTSMDSPVLRGICLMWDGSSGWVVISNTLN